MSDDDVSELAKILYHKMLAHARCDPHQYAAELGLDQGDVDRAVALLKDLGLLVEMPATDNALTALSPDTTLRHLLFSAEQRLRTAVDEVARVQEAVRTVISEYQPLHPGASPEQELVSGAENVSAMLEDAALAASRSIMSLHPGPVVDSEMLKFGLERDRQVLARGIEMRTIHLASALRVPRARAHLRELAEAGAKVRVAQSLPLRLIIVDGDLVFAPGPQAEELTVLVMRGGHQIHPFRTVFEYFWSGAKTLPWAAPVDDEPDAALTDQQQEVLRMLSSGRKDEVIARNMSLSARTVRRVVSEIMEVVGADSRFQAGVLVAQAGLLPRDQRRSGGDADADGDSDDDDADDVADGDDADSDAQAMMV